MRHLAAGALLLLLVLVARPGASVLFVPPNLQTVADATTELDLERARKLLEQVSGDSAALAFERARLSIYLGDCDSAHAILSTPSLAGSQEALALAELAKNCARATAAAVVVDDPRQGIWMRLQDEADRPLVPFIVDVAARARAASLRDLGVDLPRPLRIDLVRDLFSLSAVSGLPLTAAETTGTVAVARWGRVTMLSPRAAPLGYPWEDTLAHEITHLALSRASRDRAPLWLQEGIAKRQETRWRQARQFDEVPSADEIAHAALIGGRAVGVDKLGPSIAMLPSPEAASIAFAEVTSFVKFWIEQNGEAALRLLLADLRGVGSDDAASAMRSVTGWELGVWLTRWQRYLISVRGSAAKNDAVVKKDRPYFGAEADLTRRVRLGDLLFERGHAGPAVRQFGPALDSAKREPAIRWRVARALIEAGQPAAAAGLGRPADIDSPHGPWLGLHGRFLREAGDAPGAERAFSDAIALDPLSEDAACEGQFSSRARANAPLPAHSERRELCEAARRVTGVRELARD